MTNEEAIKIINHFPNNKPWEVEALAMAIKALEQQPCDDAISRSDALKAIEEQKKGFYGVERYAIDECHSAVMKLPSVKPQPKRGRWTHNKCDKCGVSKPPLFDNYCPNCGADMRGEEE